MKGRAWLGWLALCSLSVPAAADVYYVNDQTGNDSWNGRCAVYDGNSCGPKKTIAAALDAARSGDEIEVAPGVYTGSGDRDLDFAGKMLVLRGSDPGDPGVVAATVIDCQASEADRHRAVTLDSGEPAGTTIAGLTIRNGFGPDVNQLGGVISAGGAILCHAASLTVEHCVFEDNRAGTGGALSAWSDTPSVKYDCVLRDCVFRGNTNPPMTVNGSGGAVDAIYGNWTVTGCVFEDNACNNAIDSPIGGGAMQLWEGDVRYVDCQFINNTVTAPAPNGGNGGALLIVNRATAELVNCVLSGNHTEQNGGAIFAYDANVFLTNCRLVGNSAGHMGGAVCAELLILPTQALVTANCELTGNRAEQGGAIGRSGDRNINLSLTNSTCSGNRAASGSVLYWDGGFRFVRNCIVWNGPDWGQPGSFVVIYSDIEGGASGVGNIDAPPAFAAPGHWDDNGTPGDPGDDFWVPGDYRLAADSPAIDAADNTALPADQYDLDGDGDVAEPLPWDLAAEFRLVDDPHTADSGNGTPPLVDMGAYEYQAGILRGDLNCDGVVDYGDINPFVLALSNWDQWRQRFPDCPEQNADINADGHYGGQYGFGDINPFVRLLTGP